VDPAPRSTEEECDTEAHENWGEPMKWGGGACTSHYPVVHTAGDLLVNGGRGQGLLLVDGNLTLRGGFEFFGVVLVRGALLSGVGGARITGAVALASQGPIASSLGSIAIDFSRCAARRALLSLAFPLPVMERSWYEVFDPN
jgi:hypothetical protein